MFEKILSVFKNYAIVKISNNISDDILNCNTVFEDNNRKILGRIDEINDNTVKISFLGEFINNKYYSGIIKHPSINSKIRIINRDELNELFGYNDNNTMILGISPLYGNYPIKVNIDELFGNNTVFLGSSGSGKTYGVIRIIQNLFNMQNKLPLNSSFIIFSDSFEYYYSFKDINKINSGFNYKLYTNNKKYNGSNNIKIPLWLMSIDDYINLFDIGNNLQKDIIRKTLNIVSIIAKNDENSLKYKNHIIASAINSILNSNQINIKIREQIFNILKDCNTKEISLNAEVPAIGYTKNFSKCFDIDSRGEFIEKSLINKYIRSFIDNNIVFSGDYTSTYFTLDQLEAALNLALISDDYFLNENIYNASVELKYKLHSINCDFSNEIFKFDKYINIEQFIKSIFFIENNKVQIVNYVFDNIDTSLSKKVISIFCNILYNFYSNHIDNFPISIFLEEADKYIEKEDIFNKIIKNGKNNGMIVNFIFKNTINLPDYIFSYCQNFVVFNLSNQVDLDYIDKKILTLNFSFFKNDNYFPVGTCLSFGNFVKIPLIVKIQIPNPKPEITNISVYNNWFVDNK